MRDLPSNQFHSKPCRTCGGTERFVGDRRCVNCRRKSDRERRTSRRFKSGETFIGKPCTHHGPSVARYSANGKCVKCQKAANSAWMKANYKIRNKRYANSPAQRICKLTSNDVTRMSEEQDWKCLICQNVTKLVIDHCHKTNRFRGLVCNFCNRGLGLFRDDPIALENAIKYLRTC